jgi:hypothetical protein
MTHGSSSTVYIPSADVVSRRMGDRAVLVDLKTNRIFDLNDTGTRVWELIAEGLTGDRIVERLVSEFSVDERRAGEEYHALVAQLEREGLIRA